MEVVIWSAFLKKNIKNAFLFHGLVHSTVLPQVLQPQLLFVSIFHSLFYPDERFLKAFSFTVYKNGSATGILREQAASTTRHYFVHCLWLLGINLTKGFLRNQEQDPTFVKESIKQNQSPWDLGEREKTMRYLTLYLHDGIKATTPSLSGGFRQWQRDKEGGGLHYSVIVYSATN